MDSTKRKRSRTRSHSFCVTLGTGNTGCLVAQDLAMLTKVRSLVHEERDPCRALFSVLCADRGFGKSHGAPVTHRFSAVQLYVQWANFHCNEAHIIAKVSARRESLHLFDDLMTQLKSGQFTAPTHSF